MKCSGLSKVCVSLLLAAFFAGCTSPLPMPGTKEMGPHETVRLSAKRGDTSVSAHQVKMALDAFRKSRGQFPDSIQELSPSYLRGYSMTRACEDGYQGEHTLICYRKTGPGDCAIQVKHYLWRGGRVSLEESKCLSGEWDGGGAVYSNIAPFHP